MLSFPISLRKLFPLCVFFFRTIQHQLLSFVPNKAQMNSSTYSTLTEWLNRISCMMFNCFVKIAADWGWMFNGIYRGVEKQSWLGMHKGWSDHIHYWFSFYVMHTFQPFLCNFMYKFEKKTTHWLIEASIHKKSIELFFRNLFKMGKILVLTIQWFSLPQVVYAYSSIPD